MSDKLPTTPGSIIEATYKGQTHVRRWSLSQCWMSDDGPAIHQSGLSVVRVLFDAGASDRGGATDE